MKNIIHHSITAGGGKTTTCIDALEKWLKQGIDPKRMGYLAYMKRDVDEALKRLPPNDYQWVNTIHAVALRLAGDRVNRNRILDDRRKYLLVVPGAKINPEDDSPLGTIDASLKLWDFARNRLGRKPRYEEAYEIAPEYMRSRINSRSDFMTNIMAYEDMKKVNDYSDFTDVLLYALESNKKTGLSHTIVDESQDLSPLMWEVVKQKIEVDAIECIRAGDPDQSICSYQGVDYEYYQKILAEGEVIRNFNTFRVPRRVLDEAEDVIRRNPGCKNRELTSLNGLRGEFQRDEYPNIPTKGSVTILCRNNKHIPYVEKLLMREGEIYSGGSSPLEAEFSNGMKSLCKGLQGESLTKQELLSALSMVGVLHPTELVSKVKAQIRDDYPPDWVGPLGGIKPEFKNKLLSDPLQVLQPKKGAYYKQEVMEYLKGLYENRGYEIFATAPRIHVSTIHQSKGGEWDHVNIYHHAVPTCTDRKTKNIEEERRIKFVALTRCKESCTLFGTKTPTYGV